MCEVDMYIFFLYIVHIYIYIFIYIYIHIYIHKHTHTHTCARAGITCGALRQRAEFSKPATSSKACSMGCISSLDHVSVHETIASDTFEGVRSPTELSESQNSWPSRQRQLW